MKVLNHARRAFSYPGVAQKPGGNATYSGDYHQFLSEKDMLKRLAAEGYLEESYVATLEECLEHVRDGEQRQDCRNTVLSVFYANYTGVHPPWGLAEKKRF